MSLQALDNSLALETERADQQVRKNQPIKNENNRETIMGNCYCDKRTNRGVNNVPSKDSFTRVMGLEARLKQITS